MAGFGVEKFASLVIQKTFKRVDVMNIKKGDSYQYT